MALNMVGATGKTRDRVHKPLRPFYGVLMTTQLARRPFSRAEYHRMGQTGILSPDDHVELIEGEMVETSGGQPTGRARG
jgi:hypothetical protein